MMRILAIVALAIIAAGSVQAASTNKTTGTRVSASERVTLNSLIAAAWGKIEDPRAKDCQRALSNPTIRLTYSHPKIWPNGDAPIIVSMRGETQMPELNAQMREATAMIITCSELIESKAEEISSTLRQRRPGRAKAIEYVAQTIDRALVDSDASEYFYKTNMLAREVGTYVDAGNMGFASQQLFVPGSDPARGCRNGMCGIQSMAGWNGNQNSMDLIVEMKGNGFHSINGIPAREVIFKGIFAFRTTPTDVDIECPDSRAKRSCAGQFLVVYDGTSVTVMKNGQVWFDKSTIGGAEYAIDLSGETGSSSNTQVQTKGGW